MKFPRFVLTVVLLAGLAAPAHAANKDMERLYVQIAALQGQIADLQRASEESLQGDPPPERGPGRAEREPAEGRSRPARPGRGAARLRARDGRAHFRDGGAHGRHEAAGSAAGLYAERRRRGGTDARHPAAARRRRAATRRPRYSSGGPTTAPPPVGATAPPPRELYSQAYADYARGNYDLAIQEYREYLQHYPSTDFSDNAQYWIGECLYSKQRFAEAVEAWDELFRAYPSSDKLPDGRLKKGIALERLGRRRDALAEYRMVVERYPNSEAGRRHGSACRPDRPIRTAGGSGPRQYDADAPKAAPRGRGGCRWQETEGDMASVNKVILVGNVGRDPEIRYTQGGDPIANFSIATNEAWTDKAGQKQEHTEWHNVEVFGKTAQVVRDYVQQGPAGLRRGHASARTSTRTRTATPEERARAGERAELAPGAAGRARRGWRRAAVGAADRAGAARRRPPTTSSRPMTTFRSSSCRPARRGVILGPFGGRRPAIPGRLHALLHPQRRAVPGAVPLPAEPSSPAGYVPGSPRTAAAEAASDCSRSTPPRASRPARASCRSRTSSSPATSRRRTTASRTIARHVAVDLARRALASAGLEPGDDRPRRQRLLHRLHDPGDGRARRRTRSGSDRAWCGCPSRRAAAPAASSAWRGRTTT